MISSVFFLILNDVQSSPKKVSTKKALPLTSLSEKKIINKVQTSFQEEHVQKKPIILPVVTQTNITKNNFQNKIQLSPSLDFMKKMQNSLQPYYSNSANRYNPLQKVEEPKTEIVVQKEVITQSYIPKPQKRSINIKRQNTQNDIYEIISRFKKNSNPALSLFVAKKYYELGDYEKAYNYALITNKINKNIESSWIVFTKSLVKLGKRDKAIATLKQYIKQSHSSGARILLDEIYAGNFK
ncbi:CDC27 family protein [Sulfurimonas sp. SAG-AH-194-C20]|nr:CDC27 family protein [Sulfurimonas sp. SAG-AH-194-C20]